MRPDLRFPRRETAIAGRIGRRVLPRALAVVPVCAILGLGVAQAKSSSHHDPAGDGVNGGPDILTVKATKPAGGWIRFTITVGNRPGGVLNGDSLEVALDTDRNAHTGTNVTNSPDAKKHGADYLVFFFVQNGALQVGGAKERKGGSPTPLGANTRGAVHGATWTLDVKAHAIRNPKKLAYWAVGYTSVQSGSADYAPNKGTYSYSSR